MTDDQKREKPTLHEDLFIECLQKGSFQKIWEIINRSPNESNYTKSVTLSGGKSLSVNFRGFHQKWNDTVLDLIVKCNYFRALQEYIKTKNPLSLHTAAAEGNKVMVEVLLEAKAEPFVGNLARLTALHHAAGNGHAHLIKPLVESLKKPPYKKLYQNLLNKDFGSGTALDFAISICLSFSMKLLVECYSRIRPMNRPFDEKTARAALKAFFKELPGTKAQSYFEVIEKLFQVGDRNPSLPDFFSSKNMLMILREFDIPLDRNRAHPISLESRTKKELSFFFFNSGLKSHLVTLYYQTKSASTLLAGLHPRTGARSSLQQAAKRSSIFDVNALRLPLKLAGVSQRTTFFVTPNTASSSSSASSATSATLSPR